MQTQTFSQHKRGHAWKIWPGFFARHNVLLREGVVYAHMACTRYRFPRGWRITWHTYVLPRSAR